MTVKAQNTARRGRPPRTPEQAEASRRRIVAAARDLFAREGYAGVSMRRVAAKAGCPPSALYMLFPSKRRLLHFLWESVFTDLAAALERACADSAPSGRLAALCHAQVDFWLQRPEDYRAIFLVEDVPQEPGDAYFAQSSPALLSSDSFQRTIAEAQARGDVAPGDPRVIHSALLCALQGLVYNLICIPEYPWGDPRQLKSFTVQTLIRGLREDPYGLAIR